MKKEMIQTLKSLIEAVNKKIDLYCVILFGSQARNEAMSYSDIDLIFVGDFKKKFTKRSKIIYNNYNFDIGKGLDAFCYTPSEFKTMFYEGIVSILDSLDEGICLFGKEFFNTYKKKLNILKRRGLKKDPPVWILPKSMEI